MKPAEYNCVIDTTGHLLVGEHRCLKGGAEPLGGRDDERTAVSLTVYSQTVDKSLK